METDRLKNVDEYAAALGEQLGRWTPPQRTAFAAALAERWLSVYEVTSAAPHQAAVLRQAVDAAWDAARGRPRTERDIARLREAVAHMGAVEASSGNSRGAGACRIVGGALESSADGSAMEAVLRAAVTAHDTAAQPVSADVPDAKRKKAIWEQFQVRAEMQQHESMVVLVGRSPTLDDAAVQLLKNNCIPALPHMPESLKHFATQARALEDVNPALGQIAGIFDRMSSMLGMLQGPNAKRDLSALIQQAMPKVKGDGPQYEPEHERHVAETLGDWTDERRLAFVAALAERWLPEYEQYAEAEGLTNGPRLRRILDAVWAHLRGRRLSESTREDYSEEVRDAAPHTEDLDSNEPLVACMVLDYALECCAGEDNLSTAETVVSECCEGRMTLDSEFPINPERERQRWAEPAVRAEIAAQNILLERIGSISRFDDRAVESLRDLAARR